MSEIDKTKKYRSWFLVINEKAYTKQIKYDNLKNYIENIIKLNTEYYCFNEEKGDTGNLHIHLYLELKNPLSFSSIQKKFQGAHIEIRRGNPSEARNYVLKPEGMKFGKDDKEKTHTIYQPFQEFGDWSKYENITARGNKPPKKSDNDKWAEYTQMFESPKEVRDYDLSFYTRHRRTLEEYFNEKKENDLFEKIGSSRTGSSGETIELLNKKIYYLFGDSRVGKTYGVKLKYGSKNVFTANSCSDYPFDSYKGQAILHLDEFRSSLDFSTLLQMLQGYRYDDDLDGRNYHRLNLAETIILCTNLKIEEQYQNIKRDYLSSWQAFYNRFINGIWEMIYSEEEDKRYICCICKPSDFSPAARKALDFSEPPVDINDDVVHIQDIETFNIIKELIKKGSPIDDETINAIKSEPLPF